MLISRLLYEILPEQKFRPGKLLPANVSDATIHRTKSCTYQKHPLTVQFSLCVLFTPTVVAFGMTSCDLPMTHITTTYQLPPF